MGWAEVDLTHVLIVCDDASHARGKVAKFDTFVRIGGGGWASQHGQAGPSAQQDYRRSDGSTRRKYECKLCGLSFEGTDATLTRLLDLLAARGVTQINLKALNRVASRLQ